MRLFQVAMVGRQDNCHLFRQEGQEPFQQAIETTQGFAGRPRAAPVSCKISDEGFVDRQVVR